MVWQHGGSVIVLPLSQKVLGSIPGLDLSSFSPGFLTDPNVLVKLPSGADL